MIIGSSHIISFLDRCIQTDNFSHAYLFVGPQAVGKTHIALQCARFLQGEHVKSFSAFTTRKQDCLCDSCRAITLGAHPDVLVFSDPLAIENVRVLKKQLAQSPLVSPFHIVIIKNIQKATAEAAQALLKLLEEPSATTIFFLTTEHISSVPSTIVSRSTALHFFLVSQKEMRVLLNETKQKSFEELTPYWRGRPGRLMQLIANKSYAQRVTNEKKRAEYFLHSSLAQRFSLAEQVASLERQDALAVFEQWMFWWEHSRAFQPLNVLSNLHQSFVRTPINTQASLEYLAIKTRL